MPDLFSQIYGSPAPTAGDDLFSSIYGSEPAAAPAEGGMFDFLKPIKTAAGSAFEFLNRPSRAVAESALALKHGQDLAPGIERALAGKSEASFENLLAEEGMEPGWKRTLSGLGLDIATDPLNVVGGLPFKAAGALSKLPVVERVVQAVKEVPAVEALGKRFVPYFGLPEDYTKGRRLLESEIAARRGEAYDAAIHRFKGVSPAEARQITVALDKPGASTGVEKLDSLMQTQKDIFAAQKEKEIAAGVLDPEKVRNDYVTYLFKGPLGESTAGSLRKNLSARNPFAKPRDLVSIEQALYLGAEPHIARIAAVREATGNRAIATANFFKNAVENFSLPEHAAPAGFRGVNIAADMPIKEIFKGRVFDPAVADDLEKLVRIQESPDAISELFRAATGVWKGYATATNPGFHFRNLVSNVFNSWLGGLSPAMVPIRYAEAAAAMRGAVAPIAGHTPEAISAAMRDMGVVGTGHGAFGDVQTALEKLTQSTKGAPAKTADFFNPLSTHNILQREGRAVGSTVEDLSRVALFLDQLHKGVPLEDAALHVRKYLFDYGELTDFEKKIRNTAVPFYTWLRKNLPLQLESLAAQPQKFAHMGKVVGAVENENEKEGIAVPKEQRPEWLQRQDAVQLPVLTSKGEKVLFNPDLPFQDLDTIPMEEISKGQGLAAASQAGKTIISMLNPWLKAPAELALNREAFTGREIVPEDLGEGALTKAPAHMAALAEASPKFAEKLGMHKTLTRTGQVQWVMPARAAYLANQIPFASKLGKTIYQPQDQGSIPIPGIDPKRTTPSRLSYLGFSLTPLSEQQLGLGQASQMKNAISQQRAVMRQTSRFQPTQASQLDAILRLVLAGGLE
jgi:hypothetical protein